MKDLAILILFVLLVLSNTAPAQPTPIVIDRGCSTDTECECMHPGLVDPTEPPNRGGLVL